MFIHENSRKKEINPILWIMNPKQARKKTRIITYRQIFETIGKYDNMMVLAGQLFLRWQQENHFVSLRMTNPLPSGVILLRIDCGDIRYSDGIIPIINNTPVSP